MENDEYKCDGIVAFGGKHKLFACNTMFAEL